MVAPDEKKTKSVGFVLWRRLNYLTNRLTSTESSCWCDRKQRASCLQYQLKPILRWCASVSLCFFASKVDSKCSWIRYLWLLQRDTTEGTSCSCSTKRLRQESYNCAAGALDLAHLIGRCCLPPRWHWRTRGRRRAGWPAGTTYCSGGWNRWLLSGSAGSSRSPGALPPELSPPLHLEDKRSGRRPER